MSSKLIGDWPPSGFTANHHQSPINLPLIWMSLDRTSLTLHCWPLPVKNETVQLIAKRGISNCVSLVKSKMWSTVSKALQKSISRHLTKSFDSNNSVMLCMKYSRAAVVLPVTLKAYWSASFSAGYEQWSFLQAGWAGCNWNGTKITNTFTFGNLRNWRNQGI